MTGATAFFLPLLRRREALWLFFPLAVAVAIPLGRLADRGATPAALWTGTTPALALPAALHLTLLLAACAGIAAGGVMDELRRAPFSWTLPGLRGLVLRTMLGLALPVAALGALLAARNAAPVVAAATFGLGLLTFAAVTAGMDEAFPRSVRAALLLALAAAALLPGPALGAVARWPAAVAVGALPAALLLLGLQHGAAAARRRRQGPAGDAGNAGPLAFRGHGDGATWPRAGDLATDRLLPWVRAGWFEGAIGPGRGLFRNYLLLAAVAALAGELMRYPGLAVIMVGIVLVNGHGQLHRTLPHPLSRARQARVAWTAALTGALLAFGVVALSVLAVRAAGAIPPLPLFADGSLHTGWASTLALGFAFAPIAQWPAVRLGPSGRPESAGLRRFGPFFIYALTIPLTARLAPSGGAALAAAAAAVAVVAQGLFWLAVRRHYRRADLLPAAG
jgi:hypothetical protein